MSSSLLLIFVLCPSSFIIFFCRILGSCTSLMQAIQVLIVASKDLQKEIVESGRVRVGEGPWAGRTDVSYDSQLTERLSVFDTLIHIQ